MKKSQIALLIVSGIAGLFCIAVICFEAFLNFFRGLSLDHKTYGKSICALIVLIIIVAINVGYALYIKKKGER